jgi:Na+/H+-dicarboxylate symporter
MLLGIATGAVCHALAGSADQAATIAGGFTVVTDIFLRLIKMIIAPLVLATLVTGIAHMGDTTALGRIAGRTMLWFVAASILSLLTGLAMVNLLQPGAHSGLVVPPGVNELAATAPGIAKVLVHIVPASVIEAMAANEILQIVVFAIFAGVGLTAIGDAGLPLVRATEALSALMLRITDYVMRAAPLAVFAALAAVITTNGIGILAIYARFIGSFYAGLTVLWLLLGLIGFLTLGREVLRLATYVRAPILLAFSTASSEAAYPRTLEQLVAFGVPRRIAGMVLPLGYSFNLDGSMLYCTFAVVFIAQVYGIDLTAWQQISMLGLMFVASKGMAGVPRASLVVVAAALGSLTIPESGLLLILAIDQFLDMGRSATNVVGNALAAAVLARWEGRRARPAGSPADAGLYDVQTAVERQP